MNFEYPCINNLGTGKGDWIVGLRYPGSEFAITRCFGTDHEWQLSSVEADATAYKSNGLWTSALLTPVFTKTSTHPSVGKYQYAWTVNSPTFLSGDGVGWSTWGKYGIEKRNWEYEGETKSFAIYKGELKTEVGNEKHTSIRNYAINIKEPPASLPNTPEYIPYPFIDGCCLYKVEVESTGVGYTDQIIISGITSRVFSSPYQTVKQIRYALVFAPIYGLRVETTLGTDYTITTNINDLIYGENNRDSQGVFLLSRGTLNYYGGYENDPSNTVERLREVFKQNREVEREYERVKNSNVPSYTYGSLGGATGFTAYGAGALFQAPRIVSVEEVWCPSSYVPPPPPPPPPLPPPNGGPPEPDDPQDPPLVGYDIFYAYYFETIHRNLRDQIGNYVSERYDVISQGTGFGPFTRVESVNPYIIGFYEGLFISHRNSSVAGYEGDFLMNPVINTRHSEKFHATEIIDTDNYYKDIVFCLISGVSINDPNVSSIEVEIVNHPDEPNFSQTVIFTEVERRPVYGQQPEEDNPPLNPPPPDPNIQINGSGEDHIEITGKTFLSDTLTADYTSLETATYVIDDFTGYKLTAKNIVKNCELLQLRDNADNKITVETKSNEVFIGVSNSSFEASAQYYFYSEAGKQQINTSSTFLVDSNNPLVLTEDTTSIDFQCTMVIPKRIYAGLTDGEPKYILNPFFTALIGTQVLVAQNGDGSSWLVAGIISSIDGSEDDDLYNVSALIISVSTIKKVKFTSFGTENGAAWCGNGSFLNTVIFASDYRGYLDNTNIEELKKPLKNIGQLNLIGDKLYISRNPLVKEKRNSVETWQFIDSGNNDLDLIMSSSTQDNIFQFSNGEILSTSYYKKA